MRIHQPLRGERCAQEFKPPEIGGAACQCHVQGCGQFGLEFLLLEQLADRPHQQRPLDGLQQGEPQCQQGIAELVRAHEADLTPRGQQPRLQGRAAIEQRQHQQQADAEFGLQDQLKRQLAHYRAPAICCK